MVECEPDSHLGKEVEQEAWWQMLLTLGWPFLILGGLLVAGFFVPVKDWLEQLLDYSGRVGIWGVALICVGYIVGCLLLFPVGVLTFGAGFLYGLGGGFLAAVLGSMLGALIAYGISRWLLGDWVIRHAEKYRFMDILKNAVQEDGREFIFLTRLIPITAFALLNYAYGALKVSLWRFSWTTLLGMLPGTFLCVYIGDGLRSLSGVADDARQQGPGWPKWVGLGLTIVAVALITYYGRKIMLEAAERIDKKRAGDKRKESESSAAAELADEGGVG